MNPHLQRHHFAHCTAEAQRVLPDHAYFTAERGERCVPLTPCWPELLTDCSDLGPVALVSQNGGAQFARCVSAVDFAPVPCSTEVVDLRSALIADTVEWSHVLAVEEATSDGCLFSLQFFAHDGEGLWKLLLTRDAQLEHFASMVRHYSSDTPPPLPSSTAPPIPSHLAELRRRGCAFALEVPKETLATTLLAARRDERALTITVGRGNLSMGGTLIPRSLERCPCALHAYDYESELHIAMGESFSIWRVRERAQWLLHVLTAEGHLAAKIS